MVSLSTEMYSDRGQVLGFFFLKHEYKCPTGIVSVVEFIFRLH